jgi:MFS family permease
MGTWMQRTAVYWVVYEKTHSTFMLGAALFASQFPSFLFSLFGGVVSDKYNRYRVVLFTQTAAMVQAALLALLVAFTQYTVWEVLSFSAMLGIINAFDVPARQALVYDMVEQKEDLGNAIALNSTMVNTAGLIGPAIAGLVLAKYGAANCFALNALSFIAVLVSLWRMKLPKWVGGKQTKKVSEGLHEGWRYLKNTPSIARVILLMAVSSLFLMPYFTLMPVYAKEILHRDAAMYGYLNSFTGLGAALGAIFLALLKSGANLRRILIIATLIFGVGLILFSYAVIIPFSLAFAMMAGLGMMLQMTLVITIIQTQVSMEMRGRVISYYAMAFFGMQPLGGLLIGFVSRYIHAPATLLAQGILAIIIAIAFIPSFWNEPSKIPSVE